MRGISVFVKKTLHISGIECTRTDYGEFVTFIVNDDVKVIVFYRNPSLRTLADY